MAPGGNDLFVPTYGGGIYVPGTPVTLSASIMPISDPAYLNLDLACRWLSPGHAGRQYAIPAQVPGLPGLRRLAQRGHGRRGPSGPEADRRLRQDEPADLHRGVLRRRELHPHPGCFQERRAACFRFSEDGQTISFFDGDIYNGFVYNYSVTTFDYGNVAMAEPTSLTSDQLFSARYPGDPNSIFGYPCQLATYRVDALAAPPSAERTSTAIPTRCGWDWASRRARRICWKASSRSCFTNLPPDSHIRVYTEDGDLVAELPSVARRRPAATSTGTRAIAAGSSWPPASTSGASRCPSGNRTTGSW